MKNESSTYENRNFTDNLLVIRKSFPGQMKMMQDLGAVMCEAAGKSIDKARIKECMKLLKKSSSFVSSFRGNIKLPVCISMALSDDPASYIDEVKETYSSLSEHFVFGNDQRALCAMVIYQNSEKERRAEICERAYAIYKKMKEKHPFLASQDDLSAAALMAMSGMDEDAALGEMEKCYKLLTKRFALNADYVRNACAVLALDGEKTAEEKCAAFNDLYDALKKNKLSMGRGHELSIIAILVILGYSPEEAVTEMKKYDDFLRTQKGFGALEAGSHARRMFAATLSCIYRTRSGEGSTALSASMSAVLATVIDIQLMMIMCIMMNQRAAASNSQRK